MDQNALLQEIEASLAKTGMSPTKFGRDALKDPRFVFDLRRGVRDLRLSTVQKVRDFIAGQASQ